MKLWTGMALALVGSLSLSACIGGGQKPLDTLFYKSELERQDNLIVFMRGLGGTWRCPINAHRCFKVEGFVEAVQDRNLPYDMAAPNMHLGYYQARSLVQRLQADVILPAKANGYKRVWIVGVSMGDLSCPRNSPEFTGI